MALTSTSVGAVRTPGTYVEFDKRVQGRGLPGQRWNMLIVGQLLAAGSVAENVITPVSSDEDVASYFGRGSILHMASRAAYKANKNIDVTCLGVADAGGGVAATGTIVIGGTPATAATSLTVWIDGVPISIAIASGTAVNDVATALNTEIANYPNLPVTGGVVAPTITLTARNKGTQGNKIPLGYQFANNDGKGLTVTITAMGAVVAGATDPDATTALALAASQRYTHIVFCFDDATNYAALEAHLDATEANDNFLPGIGFIGAVTAVATATTLASNINHERVCIPFQLLTSATRSAKTPYELAAATAATMMSEPDPAMPHNDLLVKGIPPVAFADWLTSSELESLLWGGVTPIQSDNGSSPRIIRSIVTRTTTDGGAFFDDIVDVTTQTAFDYGIIAIKTNVSGDRRKNTERVRDSIKENAYRTALQLDDAEIWQNVADLKDDFQCVENATDATRADLTVPADVVNGLHILVLNAYRVTV